MIHKVPEGRLENKVSQGLTLDAELFDFFVNRVLLHIRIVLFLLKTLRVRLEVLHRRVA